MSMARRIICVALIVTMTAFLVGCGEEKKQEETPAPGLSADLFPAGGKIKGWDVEGTIETYDEKGLFAAVGDDAEKYLCYGFKQARFVNYRDGSKALTRVEIYDMGKPENAFGIFSVYDRIGKSRAPEGIEGRISDKDINFYRGNLFVRIKVENLDPPQSSETIVKFTSTIDQKIDGTAVIPELARLLPARYLTGSLKYFNSSKNINFVYDLGEGDPLFMDSGATGVAAAYSNAVKNTETGSRKSAQDQVFVIAYPAGGDELANKAFQQYVDYFSNKTGYTVLGLWNPPMRALIHKGDKLVSIIYIQNNHVFGAWNAMDDKKRETAINQLIKNLNIAAVRQKKTAAK